MVYGLHAVDAAIRKRPQAVQRLLIDKTRDDKRVSAVEALARNQGVTIERCDRGALDDLAGGRHQGVVVLLAAGADEDNLWQEERLLQWVESSAEPCLLLVLDGVTDPHNLGACLRSADAAGVDAVIVPKDRSADLSPVVRKVACGAAEVVPFVRVTNLSRSLKNLQDRGVWLYGAAGESEKTIYNSDLTGPLAFVMGAEGAGLRRLTRESCDHLVSLPMQGSVTSLNVSVATGVCLFEAVRQRS